MARTASVWVAASLMVLILLANGCIEPNVEQPTSSSAVSTPTLTVATATLAPSPTVPPPTKTTATEAVQPTSTPPPAAAAPTAESRTANEQPATETLTPEPTLAPPTATSVPQVAPKRDFDVITLLPPDAIPAISNPGFYDSLADADESYDDDDLVLGIEINGDARAYSVPLLSSHEIVNDVVGGEPVAVTW